MAEASENRPRVRTLIPMKNHSLRPLVQNSLDLSVVTNHDLKGPVLDSSSISAPWSPHSFSELAASSKSSKSGSDKSDIVAHSSSTSLSAKGFMTNSSTVSSFSPPTKFSLRKSRQSTVRAISPPSRRLNDQNNSLKQSFGQKKTQDDGV